MNRRPILSTYTPSNTDPELLKRIFVQREKLLERIVDRLSRSMTTGDKHHILLIGPRGCGKTNLVSLAVWELQKKSQLADCMRIAWLGEDDSFTGLIHLAFGIASQLSKEYPKEFPADFKTAVRGLPNDDAALAVLRSTVGRLGARNLLLVTENMDQTFHSLGDSGQKKWRAFLQETRKIATLATAQQLFSGVSDRNEAFFGFFDIQHLEPLSVDQAVELITRISLEHSNRELIRYLKSAEGQFRIRALHYLAGGNHRMYVLLSEFLTKESLDDLVAAFDSLANDMTPFFQERIRSLPDQQRQLVQCLCDAQGALTVKEVASETFIDERVCSRQLGTLKDKGYVRSEKRGKESYYDMAEPLMRLCLEVKNQHGRPLRLLARFLRAWFPVTELESKLIGTNNGRVSDYCKLAIESGDGFKSNLAMTLCSEITAKISDGDFETAERLIKELVFADPSSAKSASIEQATARLLRGITYGQQGDIELALSEFTAVIEMANVRLEQKAWALFNRGYAFGLHGYIERAVSDYSAVVELPDALMEQKACALVNRGFTYDQQGHTELALLDYSAVVEMPNAPVNQKAWALLNRGFTYDQQGHTERALSDYSKVVEMSSPSVELKARALINRGVARGQTGDVELALSDYSAVLEMPDAPTEQKAWALVNRGLRYNQQGKINLALSDYSAVIEMPDATVEQKVNALVNRGVTYGRKGDIVPSLLDFSAVVEMPNAPGEQKAFALFSRGFRYDQQGQIECALSDYSAVVEMLDAPLERKIKALVNRGVTYGRQGNIEQALLDFSAVVDMPHLPLAEKVLALLNRGKANWRKKRFIESEADFKAVLAIPSISLSQRTEGLFAIVEPMIDHCSLEEVKTALVRAFNEGARETNEYGGAPHKSLWMVLGRSPAQWANYISVIASMYIEHGCEDKLGQGITKSIQHLDEGGFSKSQIESWNAAWQQAGQGCDALEIPLRCLDAAVEVMNSDPRSDRALFRLPLELRGLIRPLLNRSLGDA
jgi:tetratricopeptide (TPR) repeat protein